MDRREIPTIVDEAFRAALLRHQGHTADDIARMMGLTRSTCSRRLRMAKLIHTRAVHYVHVWESTDPKTPISVARRQDFAGGESDIRPGNLATACMAQIDIKRRQEMERQVDRMYES